MRTALFADIHGNREAFAACLAHAARQKVDRYMFMGDIVGYGADPAWCVDQVAARVGEGAIALLGNHDEAVGLEKPDMNADALRAMEWTRSRLDKTQKEFLENLTVLIEEGEVLFVHASAASPRSWQYITSSKEAEICAKYTQKRVTICGHVHRPQCYHAMDRRPFEAFQPPSGMAVPLLRQRRWIAVLGSVGQPRDGNPQAAYGIFDSVQGALTYHRVGYDAEGAARKILAAGLPAKLGERLLVGR